MFRLFYWASCGRDALLLLLLLLLWWRANAPKHQLYLTLTAVTILLLALIIISAKCLDVSTEHLVGGMRFCCCCCCCCSDEGTLKHQLCLTLTAVTIFLSALIIISAKCLEFSEHLGRGMRFFVIHVVSWLWANIQKHQRHLALDSS